MKKSWYSVFGAVMICGALFCGFYACVVYYVRSNLKYPIAVVLFLVLILLGLRIAGQSLEKRETAVFRGRSTGLDIVRVLAVVLVITVHFIIKMGYYDMPIEGKRVFALTSFRWIAQCSCPLFMLLSGYLLNNRTDLKSHYLKFLNFLFTYVILCVIYMLLLKHDDAGFWVMLKSLANLSRYWYIDMYFGLYLLAPFLNIVWKALSSGYKKVLLAVLTTLCAVFTVTNNWTTSYWAGLYPILYYYIGASLKETGLTFRKKSTALILLALMILSETCFTFFANRGSPFDWVLNYGGYSCAYDALPTVFASVLIFLIFRDAQLHTRFFRNVFRIIANNSLEIYLIICMGLQNVLEIYFLDRLGIHSVFVYYVIEVATDVAAGSLLGTLLSFVTGRLAKKTVALINRGAEKEKVTR